MTSPLPDTLTPPHELDAEASCPQRWGWMRGSPPSADRVVRFGNGDSRRFPQLRWTFSHIRQVHPTLDIVSVIKQIAGSIFTINEGR